MVKPRNATVGFELVQRLCELRDRNGWMDKFLAKQMGVNATTLSKRLSDHTTTPDDEWIGRLANVAKLTADETAKLLVRAAMERSDNCHHAAARERLKEAWARIGQNIYLQSPQNRLPALKNPSEVLRETFDSIGIPLRGRAGRKLGDFLNQSLNDTSFAALLELYNVVTAEISDEDLNKSNFGEFSQLLRAKLGVRQLPLTKTLLSRLSSTRIPGAETRSLPLLPGIFVHLFKAPKGTTTPEHRDDGMEAILVLKGQLELIFENKLHVKLDAEYPELLLYEASLRHGGHSLTDSEVLIVHYSPNLARKWELVETLYAEQLQQEKVAVTDIEANK
jgi:transcriptional regulator with XRE-family HTH domain/quercetin dioxygenase-like cupin family protein